MAAKGSFEFYSLSFFRGLTLYSTRDSTPLGCPVVGICYIHHILHLAVLHEAMLLSEIHLLILQKRLSSIFFQQTSMQVTFFWLFHRMESYLDQMDS
jgi:hypothetical protein